MLQKGLQAFQWAILQSKHQSNTLKQRVQAITVRAAFTKAWVTYLSILDHSLNLQQLNTEKKILNLGGKIVNKVKFL